MFARSIMVRFGTAQTDWPYFVNFIELNDPLCLLKMSRIVRHKREFYSGSPTLHTTFRLYSLMTEFGTSKASRIHDKVFALSELVTTGPSVQVEHGLSRRRLATYVYRTIVDSSWSMSQKQDVVKVLAKVFKLSRCSAACLETKLKIIKKV
jgi:hypothetical protein